MSSIAEVIEFLEKRIEEEKLFQGLLSSDLYKERSQGTIEAYEDTLKWVKGECYERAK